MLENCLFIRDLAYNENSFRSIHNYKSNNQLLLFYCIDGSITLKVNKLSYSLNQNNYFILPQHSSLTLITENSKNLVLCFDCENHSKDFSNRVFFDNNKSILFFINQLNRMQNEFSNFKSDFFQTYQNLIFLKLLKSVEELNLKEEDDNFKTKIIYEITVFLEENFQHDINFEQLFSSYNYSFSYLRRLFKLHTGYSPNSFLMKIRLNESKKLLSNTNLSIDAIAKKCGFSSVKYFSAFFYKQSGITPKKFRLDTLGREDLNE